MARRIRTEQRAAHLALTPTPEPVSEGARALAAPVRRRRPWCGSTPRRDVRAAEHPALKAGVRSSSETRLWPKGGTRKPRPESACAYAKSLRPFLRGDLARHPRWLEPVADDAYGDIPIALTQGRRTIKAFVGLNTSRTAVGHKSWALQRRNGGYMVVTAMPAQIDVRSGRCRRGGDTLGGC